jgi:DinB superfamily
MNEIDRLSHQLIHSYYGPAWHGPALRELVSGITGEEATQRIVPNVHTIWELALHATAWKVEVSARIKGSANPLVGSQDWPSPGKGESGWQQALSGMEAAHEVLRAIVSSLEVVDLDRLATGSEVLVYGIVHGVIQHDLYHAGQIALIRKALIAE